MGKAYLFRTAYADAISLHVAYVGGQSAGFSSLLSMASVVSLAGVAPGALPSCVCCWPLGLVLAHVFSLVHAQGLEAWHLH